MSLNNSKTELLVRDPTSPSTLTFCDGTPVNTTTQVKYVGSLVSWNKPFETAFYHRAGLAESSYKSLRLVWNSSLPHRTKVKIFQATFVPILIYGLEAFPLTNKHLLRIDATYFKFLRRVIGVKASYFSRVSNHTVHHQAGYPTRPSMRLAKAQLKYLHLVYLHKTTIQHSVVFCSAYKDRIVAQGRRRGMQFPYWLETTAKRFFPELWTKHLSNHSAHGIYLTIRDLLRKSEMAPKRAHS